MDEKTKTQLEQARGYCYEWRLQEAYGIFRRFFDRLPFQPEKEHADYIGLFVRILLELGKEYELKFYMNELERLFEQGKDPSVGYQLAFVYTHVPEPRVKAAKEIFDSIVANPAAKALHVKAKVMLISHYDRLDDHMACRRILDSIEEPKEDPTLNRIVRIWRANIFSYYEKRYDVAEGILQTVLSEVTFRTEWYTYFSAKVSQAKIALAKGQPERTSAIVSEIRRIFDKKRCKSIQYEIEFLDKMLKERDGFDTLQYIPGEPEHSLCYANKTLTLKGDTAVEKLLLLLVKKKFINKENIVRKVYAREYEADRDDKLIYYQIHSLRKRLRALGLPPDAILSKGNGYKLVPPVEILGE